MKICKHCNTEYSYNKNNHYRVCEGYQEFLKICVDTCTKEYLYEEYVIKERSFIDISRELGLEKDRLVKKIFREYNLPERTTAEWNKAKGKRDNYKKTSLLNHGFDHPSKNEIIYEKCKHTLILRHGVDNMGKVDGAKEKSKTTSMERYGFENAMQSNEFKNKVKHTCLERYGVEHAGSCPFMRAKRKDTMIKRYGFEHPAQNPEIRKQISITKAINGTLNNFYSKSSQEFLWKIFHMLPDEIKTDCYFAENKGEYFIYSDQIYYIDFTIPSLKICIEYNGDYFHANPKKYNKDYYFHQMKKTANQIWEYDAKKLNDIQNKGFECISIWESESKDELIISNIVNKILSTHKIHKDSLT